MTFTDTGKDKIQQICDQLRKETLDPARAEADGIIKEAEDRAAQIVAAAKQEAQNQIDQAKVQIEKEREVLNSSLKLAGKKSLSYLKQEIGSRIFNPELNEKVTEHLSQEDVIAQAIKVLFDAIEKEGFAGNLEVALAKGVSAEGVMAKLTENVRARISGGAQVGDFQGGATVKVVDQNLMVDLSDEAIAELMKKFLAPTFHSFIFEE